MKRNDLKGLILGKILTDLKLERAQLEEAEEPHDIQLHDEYLKFDGIEHPYEVDLPFYRRLCIALVDVYPHYKDILGDDVYYNLNRRTHNDTTIDVVGTQCVIVKRWSSKNGSIQVVGYQLMSDTFRGFVFETGGQWIVAIRFNKRSWEYYASRQRSTEIALFPYFADLFITGEVVPVKSEEKLLEILDKCLPDWYPLVKSGSLG